MRDDVTHKPYNVVLLTLDRHAAGPAMRVAPNLAMDFPGLKLKIHAAAEWGKDADALAAAKADIATANIIVTSVIFLEDHIQAILPGLNAHCEILPDLGHLAHEEDAPQVAAVILKALNASSVLVG